MAYSQSELIINPDGSIYHLHLLPGEVGDIIFTVGDPGRVPMVSRYFDEILLKKSKREFITHTGRVGSKVVSVISSGIGTDNIDILINEVDALCNIDLDNREVKDGHRSVTFIRLGTSGSVREEIPIDSLVASAYGIGMDSLRNFYAGGLAEDSLQDSFLSHLRKCGIGVPVYAAAGTEGIADRLVPDARKGITISCPGFYGPQSRSLRIESAFPAFVEAIRDFRYKGLCCTNFEMETAGIYFLAGSLGHKALSVNTILANRMTGKFSSDPYGSVDRMIRLVLDGIESI